MVNDDAKTGRKAKLEKRSGRLLDYEGGGCASVSALPADARGCRLNTPEIRALETRAQDTLLCCRLRVPWYRMCLPPWWL